MQHAWSYMIIILLTGRQLQIRSETIISKQEFLNRFSPHPNPPANPRRRPSIATRHATLNFTTVVVGRSGSGNLAAAQDGQAGEVPPGQLVRLPRRLQTAVRTSQLNRPKQVP